MPVQTGTHHEKQANKASGGANRISSGDTFAPHMVALSGPHSAILGLQRAVGNRAVDQIIQTKLAISRPGDQFEQEADRAAEQVMRMPAPQEVAGAPVIGQVQTRYVQRVCQECEEELQRKPQSECDKRVVQTKEGGGAAPEVSQNAQSQLDTLRGGGQPMPMRRAPFLSLASAMTSATSVYITVQRRPHWRGRSMRELLRWGETSSLTAASTRHTQTRGVVYWRMNWHTRFSRAVPTISRTIGSAPQNLEMRRSHNQIPWRM